MHGWLHSLPAGYWLPPSLSHAKSHEQSALTYCKNIAKSAYLLAHIVGCMRANGITVACIQYEYTILAYHHTPLKQESSYIRVNGRNMPCCCRCLQDCPREASFSWKKKDDASYYSAKNVYRGMWVAKKATTRKDKTRWLSQSWFIIVPRWWWKARKWNIDKSRKVVAMLRHFATI